jgi:hypothetical protein
MFARPRTHVLKVDGRTDTEKDHQMRAFFRDPQIREKCVSLQLVDCPTSFYLYEAIDDGGYVCLSCFLH